ncbi:hypothetical protein VNO80_25932 [Phaseolus coccineus]|uniref:Uncharacterized protein n=1 Tax=Phaseolus coccineus TaxID=3886 RepID=A0AAN9LZI2_PHACN
MSKVKVQATEAPSAVGRLMYGVVFVYPLVDIHHFSPDPFHRKPKGTPTFCFSKFLFEFAPLFSYTATLNHLLLLIIEPKGVSCYVLEHFTILNL